MSFEAVRAIPEDVLDRAIRYMWDFEAVILFGTGTLSLLDCVNRVMGRYLLFGWTEPLVDALTRSTLVPNCEILRIVGKMHELSAEGSTEEMPPYMFVAVERTTRKTPTFSDRCNSMRDDDSLLKALSAGEVRPLVSLFQSGKHPGWPVLNHYVEMHREHGQTAFTFQIKRRDGRPGRRIDPQILFLQFLAAGLVEWLKYGRGWTHEMACVRAGELIGGDHEEWSRKASRAFGSIFRRHLVFSV